MKGKPKLMAGLAVFALVASANSAYAAAPKKHRGGASPPSNSQTDTPVETTTPAPPPGPTNAELAARIQALEDELEAYKEKEAGDHSRISTIEQNASDTSWTFDNGRPTVRSGDGRFTMAVRGRFQTDVAYFDQNPSATTQFKDLGSGAVERRAYFGVEGKAFNDFWYELRLNAGGSNGGLSAAGASAGAATAGEGDPLLNLARIAYTGIPNFRINVGIIEPAFMFEGTTSSGQLTFLERPEIDNIAADAFGAGDSRRGVELTFQKTNALWGGDNLVLTGAFTGNKTGSAIGHGNGGDEQTQILGRVSDRLWTDGISNLQIGGSAAEVLNSGGGAGAGVIQLRDRPEVRIDGTRLIDTGGFAAKKARMYAADAGMNFRNFFLGGEYAHFDIDRLKPFVDHPSFSGYYVEGSWILTGETKSYSASALNNEVGGFNGPVPSRPFSLSGGSWGAWEVALRYSDTDLNWRTSALTGGVYGGEEQISAVALNWYLNREIRVMLDDNIVKVSKLSGLGGTQIGQNFNVVMLRLQFSN